MAPSKVRRMSLSVIHTRALVGLHAPEVVVEVHLANGLPSFTLVGLADVEVKEARERVRAALSQSGFAFPHNKKVTVNLAPADLPKESGRFDLPIALGVLAAQGLLDAGKLARCEFAGELSLAGELRPVRGALALALAVRESGCARRLVLPAQSAAEAARVEGVDIRSARTLGDVVQAFLPGDGARDLPGPAREQAIAPPPLPDLVDVKGQAGARRALEVAAAGAHGLLLIGPPGAGKSMLAERLAGLLPQMTPTEALASAALLSVSSQGLDVRRFGQRPVRSPHHSASAVALVGGGSPPRPVGITRVITTVEAVESMVYRGRRQSSSSLIVIVSGTCYYQRGPQTMMCPRSRPHRRCELARSGGVLSICPFLAPPASSSYSSRLPRSSISCLTAERRCSTSARLPVRQ